MSSHLFDWATCIRLAGFCLVWAGCNQAAGDWEDAKPASITLDAGASSALDPFAPWVPNPSDGGVDPGLPPPGEGDAGSPQPPQPPDAEPPPNPHACSAWSDCAPFFGDPNSGFACENNQCVCDPAGNAHQNCIAAGGNFLESSCYCEIHSESETPPDVGGSCQVWQDCAPYYDDQNSGFDCISQACTCDPQNMYAPRCTEYGGYWVQAECFCAFADEAPPGAADEDCYWRWDAPPCDPDRWVDTSHYECRYDERNELRCDVWVQSGYWEDGACPTGHWEEICY